MAWFKSSKKKDTKLEENKKKIINDDKPAPIYDDAEMVARTGIVIESGFYYFIGFDGDIWRDNTDEDNAMKVANAGIVRESGFYYFIGSDGIVYRSDSEKYLELDMGVGKQIKAQEILKKEIIKLLKEKAVKIAVSDIDAFLKHQNVSEIKELCAQMYQDGDIDFAGNGRYFILSDEKKEPKKATEKAKKTESVDVEKELEKLKGLLDKGLITQEQYDAKSNELLGL